jgi:hypothetical protein
VAATDGFEGSMGGKARMIATLSNKKDNATNVLLRLGALRRTVIAYPSRLARGLIDHGNGAQA